MFHDADTYRVFEIPHVPMATWLDPGEGNWPANWTSVTVELASLTYDSGDDSITDAGGSPVIVYLQTGSSAPVADISPSGFGGTLDGWSEGLADEAGGGEIIHAGGSSFTFRVPPGVCEKIRVLTYNGVDYDVNDHNLVAPEAAESPLVEVWRGGKTGKSWQLSRYDAEGTLIGPLAVSTLSAPIRLTRHTLGERLESGTLTNTTVKEFVLAQSLGQILVIEPGSVGPGLAIDVDPLPLLTLAAENVHFME